MNATSLDRAGEGSSNGGVAQLFLRERGAGFARNQHRFQALYFLQGQVIACLGAVIAALYFVELLLGDELIAEHLFGATILPVGVKQVGLGTLDRSHLPGIGGRRRCGSNAELGPDLLDNALLPVHFVLQFPLIEEDQGLTFTYRVSDIDKDLINAALDLRAQRALLKRQQRAHGLNAATVNSSATV